VTHGQATGLTRRPQLSTHNADMRDLNIWARERGLAQWTRLDRWNVGARALARMRQRWPATASDYYGQ